MNKMYINDGYIVKPYGEDFRKFLHKDLTDFFYNEGNVSINPVQGSFFCKELDYPSNLNTFEDFKVRDIKELSIRATVLYGVYLFNIEKFLANCQNCGILPRINSENKEQLRYDFKNEPVHLYLSKDITNGKDTIKIPAFYLYNFYTKDLTLFPKTLEGFILAYAHIYVDQKQIKFSSFDFSKLFRSREFKVLKKFKLSDPNNFQKEEERLSREFLAQNEHYFESLNYEVFIGTKKLSVENLKKIFFWLDIVLFAAIVISLIVYIFMH